MCFHQIADFCELSRIVTSNRFVCRKHASCTLHSHRFYIATLRNSTLKRASYSTELFLLLILGYSTAVTILHIACYRNNAPLLSSLRILQTKLFNTKQIVVIMCFFLHNDLLGWRDAAALRSIGVASAPGPPAISGDQQCLVHQIRSIINWDIMHRVKIYYAKINWAIIYCRNAFASIGGVALFSKPCDGVRPSRSSGESEGIDATISPAASVHSSGLFVPHRIPNKNSRLYNMHFVKVWLDSVNYNSVQSSICCIYAQDPELYIT